MSVRVCSVHDVPRGEGRTVTVAGRRIAVFNAAAGWFALDAVCPHRGGPLADGLLGERSVACPLHERRFDLATGEALTEGEGVGAYRVEVDGEEVYVVLDAQRPARPSS